MALRASLLLQRGNARSLLAVQPRIISRAITTTSRPATTESVPPTINTKRPDGFLIIPFCTGVFVFRKYTVHGIRYWIYFCIGFLYPPRKYAYKTTLNVIFKFNNWSQSRDLHHYTSYFLALGIPASLVFGGPVSTVVDLCAGVIIPTHFHLGMRSVIIDYVHPIPTQRMALGALAAVTILTMVGLTYFNYNDIGLTGAIKNLYIRQPAPIMDEVKAKKH